MFHVLLFCRGCSFLRNSQTPGNFFKKSDESTFKCFEFILSLQLCILCRMLNRLPSRLEEIGQLGSKNLFCTQLYAFLLIIKLTKYFSETDLIDQGLIIELWNKGVLWVIFCSFAKICNQLCTQMNCRKHFINSGQATGRLLPGPKNCALLSKPCQMVAN